MGNFFNNKIGIVKDAAVKFQIDPQAVLRFQVLYLLKNLVAKELECLQLQDITFLD